MTDNHSSAATTGVQLPLSTDMVLTAAKEVQTHLDKINKPYSAGIIGDCIVEIERLRDQVGAQAMRLEASDAAQAREDLVLLPRKLTAENGAKAALIGEFKETVEIMDEDGEEHPMDVPVSWDTIKRIWDAAVAHFASKTAATPVQSCSAGSVPPEGQLAGRDCPGVLESNPALFNILNNALGTMHYHRLMSALNWNGYVITREPQGARK